MADAKAAQQKFEEVNKIENVTDTLYNYDQKKHNALTSGKPWLKE